MKPNLIPLTNQQPQLTPGRIVGGGPRDWMVQTEAGVIAVRRAVSCLVEPAVGDQVLISRGGGTSHVLAVLDREGDQSVALTVDGNASLRSRGGELSFQADTAIRQSAPEMHVTTAKARIHAEDLQASGGRWQLVSRKLSVITDFAEHVANQMVQRAKRVFRQVDELDQLDAGNTLTRVKGVKSDHAHDSVQTARKEMKVDAERIHMG